MPSWCIHLGLKVNGVVGMGSVWHVKWHVKGSIAHYLNVFSQFSLKEPMYSHIAFMTMDSQQT